MKKSDELFPMSLNENYYVVMANALVKGRQLMTKQEAQLLMIVISQIAKTDIRLKSYTTTVKELAEFMNVSEYLLYRDLPDICSDLCSRVVEIHEPGWKKWRVFNWIKCAEYCNGKLTIRISDEIRPYLLQLNACYSQTQLKILLNFDSYYAIRLYQYLWAEVGEHKVPKDYWEFTIEELRELFQTKKKYKQATDLIKKTLRVALDELASSDYVEIWDYQEHKAAEKGAPIAYVSFHAKFFPKAVAKELSLPDNQLLAEHSPEITVQDMMNLLSPYFLLDCSKETGEIV